MYCDKCGEQVERDEKYCPACGANLREAEQPADGEKQPDSKKMIWGGALVLGLVALAVLLLALLPSDTKSLEKIVASAPTYYEGFIMGNLMDEAVRYEKLLASSETALANHDKQQIKELLQQWKKFKKDMINKNDFLYQDQLHAIKAMDTSLAYEDELTRIKEYKEQASLNQERHNYVAAVQQLQDCIDLLNQINHSGEELTIHVAQIDTTDFPVIRLYLEIEGDYGKVPENLPQDVLQVQELSSGTEYSLQQVTKLVQVDQNANLNINVVADVSGSMSGDPMLQAQYAMQLFLESVQFEIGDQVELTAFSDYVTVTQPFTDDLPTLKNQMNRLQVGDMTSLYDALYASVMRTAKQNGAKYVIAFTDGMDNHSNCTAKDVIEVAKRYRIPVYIVGIGKELDDSALRSIAEQTDGDYWQILHPSIMSNIYSQIYQDKKQLYLLEYTTSDSQNIINKRSVQINTNSRMWNGQAEVKFSPNVLLSVENEQADYTDEIALAVSRYLHGFVDAINTHQYSYLADAVVDGSPIASIQEKYIQRDIAEKLQSYEIIKKQMQDEQTCIVTVRETYDIDTAQQPLHMLVQRGSYVLKKQDDGSWKFYDFAKNVEVLKRLND